jgi:hypothetical protein
MQFQLKLADINVYELVHALEMERSRNTENF